MRNTKLKSILQVAVIFCVLTGLLLCLSACKKKPAGADASTTTEPSTTTQTEELGDQTTPTTKPTYIPKPSEATTPPETTLPKVETVPNTCNHVLGNWIVGETANCTKEGSRYIECTLCGEKVVTEAIPKTAHAPSEWKGTKATCTQEGAMYQECTQCREKLVTIVVDKADHRTGVTPGRAATATATGLTDYYWCKDCDFEQKHYTIPAAGTVPYEVQGSTITGLGNWTGSELILPATINGKTITAIGSKAFAGNTSIKTVYIPKSVKEIGKEAFSGCSALTTIVYEGAMKDWITVIKADQWNNNTGSYKIHCNNRILSK